MDAPVIAYQSDRVTVYHGDAADLVGLLPTVDLLATDPPYGVKWNSGRNRFGPLLGDDGTLDVPGILGAITRAHLRRKRHVYVFGYRPDHLCSSAVQPTSYGIRARWDPADSTPHGDQHTSRSRSVSMPHHAQRARKGKGAWPRDSEPEASYATPGSQDDP